MRKARKVLLICHERDIVNLLNLAQKLEIKFIISSNLEEALRIIKRCGEKYLSAVISDFNSSKNDEGLAIEIIAQSAKFFMPTLVYVNKNDSDLINDIENYLRFSPVNKYPLLKKGTIDWEKAIYELNFFMTR